MKLITFAVPSYNSQNYLRHCVDTLLSGGDAVEIIIVNDGSRDNTAAIADEYAANYPTIVRAIHKENGGHGSGVNRGLAEATGLYYKVVDSDDWVNEPALNTLLQTIRTHQAAGTLPDLYVTNYVYEHASDNSQFVRKFHQQLPAGRMCGWDDMGRFYGAQVLMMHSLIYRTETVRQSGTVLPEHTFYVDNIYSYKPLPMVEKIFYLDVDLYRYFIGRDDQSVNMKNFVRRYDQQLRVMELMTDTYTYAEIRRLPKPLCRYMLHDLSAIMLNTMLFCCGGGEEPERIAAHDAMWARLRAKDPAMYSYLTRRGMPTLFKALPWKLRGKVMVFGYKVLCKFVKLG